MSSIQVDPSIISKVRVWTTDSFDKATRDEVADLIANKPQELVECFYTDLDFGTGGLRGIMGVGTNRINQYTLGMATQGLCNYLKKVLDKKDISIAIAHDSRINSKVFARQVAEVISANGIKSYLFEDLRPTPQLSFAVRHLGCDSGIVLTASHNPKEYNGYKVYWNDGGQLVPPHDKGVIDEVRKVKVEDIRFSCNESLIEYIGKDLDRAYLDVVKRMSLSNAGKKDLKIVYTALHGTSGTLLPLALKESGFTDVISVKEQEAPDGNFPTVHSPNPEEAAALEMAVQLAESTGADLVIGCDPDADRVGIAVRDQNGKMVLLNGNQTGSLLIDYILKMRAANDTLPKNAFIAETVVTTDLIEAIAGSYGVETKKCLTGFKWIAEIIRNAEGKEVYIAGGEESYGYLIGDEIRDKDAIGAAVMIAEAAAHAKSAGSSLFHELVNLYVTHGFYLEHLISITKKGKSGLEEIQQMIEEYRSNTPKMLGGATVEHILDYQSGVSLNMKTGKQTPIGLPSSNFIQFVTDQGDRITARPSGTEPKIKFYFSVKENLAHKDQYEQVREKLLAKIEKMVVDLGLK